MKLNRPEVHYINISDVVVTFMSAGMGCANASNPTDSKCNDSWTGGVLTCNGSKMEAFCGAPMARTY